MNYWIICLPREDMEHCIKINKFGLNRNYLLGQMQVGDQVACYVSKEFKVIAFGEITEPYYVDDSEIFRGASLFPDRIGFKAHRLPKRTEIEFKPLVNKLSFIKDKVHWAVSLRRGVCRIDKYDWDLLQDEATCDT